MFQDMTVHSQRQAPTYGIQERQRKNRRIVMARDRRFLRIVGCFALVLLASNVALSQIFTDDFDDEFVEPGWILVGLGNANQQSVTESGGKLFFTSDGSTAFLGPDNAGFLYREVSGDFRVEVTVDTVGMNSGGPFRKAGLMVRANTDPTAARIQSVVAPYWNDLDQTHLQIVARQTPGGPGNLAVSEDVVEVPRLLRLAISRVGNTLITEYSSDGGGTWILPTSGLGGHILFGELPETLLLGLVVVSNDISTTSTAVFDDFLIDGEGQPASGQLTIAGGETDQSSGMLLITGRNFGDESPFAGRVSLFAPMRGVVELSVVDFDVTTQQILVELPSGIET
ncbi:MAG: DUF1349 domain-containing protein, partial [Holophagales bacterium]|nr:DUF1349 domain-containing protein [Holophagales bacterium]